MTLLIMSENPPADDSELIDLSLNIRILYRKKPAGALSINKHIHSQFRSIHDRF